ncbi:MAG: DUF4349 domain-containing protein [Symbiobacteriia bacterium]
MLCELAGELLSAYLDDELPSREALSLEKHLRVCPTCVAQLGELREMRAMLASLEDMAPPPGFHAALHRRLVAAAPAGTVKVASLAAARQRRQFASRWVAAAAAAAVMAVSAGSYYWQLGAHQAPPEVAILVPHSTGPAVSGTGTDTTPPTTGESTDKTQPAGGSTVSTNPTGNKTDSNQSGSNQPGSNQIGSSGSVTPPQPSTAGDGVTPPQPTQDDGVSLASQQPTTSGTGLTAVPLVQTGVTLQGQLLVYRTDIKLQAPANEIILARLFGINGDFGGTMETETVGNVQLSGSTGTAKLVTLRVPVAKYQEAKAKVLAIAPATVQDYGPLDVTAQANKLQQELNNLLAAEAFLAENTNTATDAAARLATVRQRIPDCQQQLQTYYDQAQLATLQVMVVD